MIYDVLCMDNGGCFLAQFHSVIRSSVPGVDRIKVSKIYSLNWRFDFRSSLRIIEGVDGLGGRNSKKLVAGSW